MKINEQLILECIGKANRDGLGLRGKIRTKTQELQPKVTIRRTSFDESSTTPL